MKPALPLLVGLSLLAGGCMTYPSDKAGSTVSLKASLDGKHEAPPVDTAAGAYVDATYSKETRILKWRLAVSGLSTPMTRAYFHGPDMLDRDAPLVEINTPFNGNTQSGGATLSEAQAADLLAGRWYLEIQTEKYPAGEIRGQVVKVSR